MHKLLERQLKKHFGSLDNLPEELKAFIEDINRTYQDTDAERELLEKAFRSAEAARQRAPDAQSAHPLPPKAGLRFKTGPLDPAIPLRFESDDPQAGDQQPIVVSSRKPADGNGGVRRSFPITLRDQALGSLHLSFSDEETAQNAAPLLEQISTRLALALENARLFSETQTSLARTGALYQVSRSAIAFENLPGLLQALAENIALTLPADRVFIAVFDRNQPPAAAPPGAAHLHGAGPGVVLSDFQPLSTSLHEGLHGWALQHRQPLLVSKNQPDPRESVPERQYRENTRSGSAMILPLLYRNETIGLLTAINAHDQPDFTAQDLEFMVAVAGQAATAIENARLFQAQQQRAAELQAAAEVSRAASSFLNLDELLTQTVEVIRERFGLYYVGIFLVDASGEWAELRAGTGEAGRIQLEQHHKLQVGGESMIGQAIALKAGRVAQDVGEEALRYVNPVLPETRSEMALPLISRGHTIGAMTIQSSQPAAFSEESITTLQTMADQLANAIENARLFEQAEARARELAVLNEMGRSLSEIRDVDSVVEQVFQYASRLLDTDNFYLALHYPEQNEIEFKLYTVDGERVTIQDRRRKSGKGLTEHVIRTRKPLLIPEKVDEYIRNLTGVEAIGRSAQSWLGVPMLAGNQVVGVITVQNYTTPNHYTEQHLALLVAVASQAAIALENARLFEQTQLQNQELAILNELGRVLTVLRDQDLIFQNIYDYTARLTEFTSCVIAFYNEQLDEISFPFVMEKGERLAIEPVHASSGLIAYVIRTKAPLLISENLPAHAEALGIQIQTVGEPAQSWMAAPILLGETLLGVISLQTTNTPGLYTKRHIDLLTSVSNQIATALQNAELFLQAERQNRELALLNEMSRVLITLLDVDALIEQIHLYTTRLIQSQDFFMAFYDEETDTVSFPYVIDEGKRIEIPAHPLGNSLTDYVIKTGTPLLLSEDIENQIADLQLDQLVIGQPSQSWLGVPLTVGQQVIGAIGIQNIAESRAYSEHDRDLLIAIAGQASIALRNSQLFQQTQEALAVSTEQARRLAVLNQLSAQLAQAKDLDQVFNLAVSHISQIFNANQVSFSILRPDHQLEIHALHGEQTGLQVGQLQPLAGTINEAALLDYRIVIVPETQADAPGAIRSLMAAPVSSGGDLLGVLNIGSLQPHAFTQRDENLLQQVVTLLGTFIANRQLFELAEKRAQESQARSEELALVNRVVAKISAAFDLQEGLNIVAEELGLAVGAGRVGVALLNETGRDLTVVAEYRRDVDNPTAIGVVIPIEGNPSTQQVLKTKQPLIIEDAQNDPRLAPLHDVFRERGVRSLVIMPLLARGEVMGTLGVDILEEGEALTAEQIALAETIVYQASSAINNARLYEQTQQALLETASLYQASAELNAVQVYDDILNILQKYTPLGDPPACQVTLHLFDHPWTEEDPAGWLIPIASWARTADLALTQTRYSLLDLPGIAGLFQPDAPTLIADASLDPRFADEMFPALYPPARQAGSAILVPLIVGRKWIGHLIGLFEQPTSLSNADVRRLTALAQQAAVAVQNLRLLAESRRRASQLLTAAEIARSASETLAQEDLLYRAVHLIRERFGYYHASIFLLDDARAWAVIRESTGEAGAAMKQQGHRLQVGSQSVIGTVTFTGEPLVVNDVSKDQIHRPNPLLPETRAELGIPLKIGRRVLGALDVQSTEVDAFSPDDVSVLQILADQIAIAIDNSRSYALAQQAFKDASDRLEELGILYEISASLTAAPLLTEQIAEIIASRVASVIGGVSNCSVALYEPETDMMRVMVDAHLTENGEVQMDDNPHRWDFKLSEFPGSKQVMETLQPLLVQADSPEADPRELQYLQEVGGQTLLILPLAAKGQAFGVVEVEDLHKKREFTAEQINLAMTVVNQGAGALENARLYEEQLRTSEQLRELDKLKNQFLANMSHELRTPLNSIIGFSRVILKGIDGPITEMQEQDLNAIYNAGNHLLGLINDILDISRIEAGKMELAFEQVDLTQLIPSVMATAKGLVKEKPIELETYLEPDLPHVWADPTRLRQVILNLLQNSAKFTDQGYISVKAIRHINEQGGLEVMISVSDTGIGIAPEDQDKLFQPFSQVDASPTRRTGGTGLGLSITRNLVELHGGKISVTSDVGQGSTFYFTIPAALADGARLEAEDGLVPSAPDGKKVVLAIEDEERIIQLYQRYLEPEGYHVIPLTDPARAVQRAKQLLPFAITLDVQMPEMDGWQVIQALKADSETAHIPIIFCTIVENQAKGFRLGAADYLMKPILGEDLLDTLSQLEQKEDHAPAHPKN